VGGAHVPENVPGTKESAVRVTHSGKNRSGKNKKRDLTEWPEQSPDWEKKRPRRTKLGRARS